MAGETVSILEGDTFVVSNRRGDIDASPAEAHGLFNRDTRYLSRWSLTVGGQTPRLLSTDDANYFYAQFFLVPAFLRGELAFEGDLFLVSKLEGDLFLVSKLDRYARGSTGEITDAIRRRSS